MDNNQQFNPNDTDVYSNSGDMEDRVTWTASEFIQNEKSKQWFLMLGIMAAVLGVIVFFVAGLLSAIVVGLALIVLGVVGARPPRTLNYVLDNDGLQIGQKTYLYDQFRSFSLIDEGVIDSIQLTPMKKVMPPITIYFTPEDGDRIVSLLSVMLPHEDKKLDIIDRLMNRLHF